MSDQPVKRPEARDYDSAGELEDAESAYMDTLLAENHRLDMDAETYKQRMDTLENDNRRLNGIISGDAEKAVDGENQIATLEARCAEQAATIERLRGLLVRVPEAHIHVGDQLRKAIDAELAKSTR